MANNDAEVKIGVKLDTTGLKDQLQKELQDIYANVGGDKFFKSGVTKDWTSIPFYQAHNSGGNAWATSALNAGVHNDMLAMGYNADSIVYQNAMTISSLKYLMPDAYQRGGLLRAYGLNGAAASSSGNLFSNRIVEQNARLMSMPFAQDYIEDNMVETPVLTPTGRHKYHNGPNGEKVLEFTKSFDYKTDFQGMREKAVELGLGRWTDRKKHDASTFEFIDKDAESVDKKLEKISEKTKKTKKNTKDWHEELKGVLGTLTAIGSIAGLGKLAEKGISFLDKATDKTIEGSGYMPNDRWYYNMSPEDIIRTRNAGNSLSLGQDVFYNGITALARKSALFTTLGEGLDPTASSLLGVLDKIVANAGSPMEAYLGVAQALVDNNNGVSPTVMAALIDKLGLPGIADLTGAVKNGRISNVYEPFAMVNNPFYSSYLDSEQLAKDLIPINESIKASYQQLYNDFTSEFGLPFKKWWDKTLKELIVPFVGDTIDNLPDTATNAIEGANNILESANDAVKEQIFLHSWDKFLNKSARKNTPDVTNSLAHLGSDVIAQEILSNPSVGMDNVPAFELKMFKWGAKGKGPFNKLRMTMDEVNKVFNEGTLGIVGQYNDYYRVMSYLADINNYADDDNVYQARAAKYMQWLGSMGFDKFLSNNKDEPIDKTLIDLGNVFMHTSNIDAQNDMLDKFLYTIYKETPQYQEVVDEIKKISDWLINHPEDLRMIQLDLGDNKYMNADIDTALGR